MFTTEIIGNLGCNAEKKTINGREYVSLRVPVNVRQKGDDGKYVDVTYWVDVLYCGSWGLLEYLLTGSVVYLRGSLSFRHGKDANADKIYLSMMADELRLLHSTNARRG